MDEKQSEGLHSGDLPLGLAMALAQNPEAMTAFSAMDAEAQQNIIRATHSVKSKAEMQQYVSAIANRTEVF